MTIPLSARTKRVAAIILDETDRPRIEERLLAETSEGIPLWSELTPEGLERIRFAILKLISQNPENENLAFADARMDWRDLFVAAGFADSPDDHGRWYAGLTGDG